MSGLMQGKRAFVTGVANDRSIAWAIAELRRNPMSRRVVVSAWAPDNAQSSKLPPCHHTFVCNVQNDPNDPLSKLLCLHLTQRSAEIWSSRPFAPEVAYALPKRDRSVKPRAPNR